MPHVNLDPAEIALQNALGNFVNELVEQVHFARRKFPGRENPTIAALGEEVGELCKAMISGDHAEIFLEAVQVATMAFRCHYDGDAGTDAYRAARGLGQTGHLGTLDADPLDALASKISK